MDLVIGPSSPLWFVDRDVALVMWVSMPSANEEIDLLRRSLVDLLKLEEPVFRVSSMLEAVSYTHLTLPTKRIV